MSRYPYEDEINTIVNSLSTPEVEFNQIRDLVYRAMTDSFNRGIEFQKSGKRGMSV